MPDKQFAFKVLTKCTQGHDKLRANCVRKTVQNLENRASYITSRIRKTYLKVSCVLNAQMKSIYTFFLFKRNILFKQFCNSKFNIYFLLFDR